MVIVSKILMMKFSKDLNLKEINYIKMRFNQKVKK